MSVTSNTFYEIYDYYKCHRSVRYESLKLDGYKKVYSVCNFMNRRLSINFRVMYFKLL